MRVCEVRRARDRGAKVLRCVRRLAESEVEVAAVPSTVDPGSTSTDTVGIGGAASVRPASACFTTSSGTPMARAPSRVTTTSTAPVTWRDTRDRPVPEVTVKSTGRYRW